MYSEMEQNLQKSRGFLISIILNSIGVSLLVLLISFIPVVKDVFWNSEQQPLNYSNFFFKWEYSQWHDSYNLVSFKPSIGYYIFTPIIGLFLLISNSCILIQSEKKTRQSIFINWGFFILPIIVFIIKISLIAVSNEIAMPYYVIPILITLGFYALIYLPLQILLLIEKKTTREFFALQKKEQMQDRKDIIRRRINALFVGMIYLYASGLLFHSVYGELQLFTLRNIFAVVILLITWFISNIAVYRYKYFTRKKKNLFSLFTGILTLCIMYFIIYITDPLIAMDIMSFNVYDLQFPRTMIIAIFYITAIFLVSMPIGFFGSNKKDIALIVSLFSLPFIVLGIFLTFSLFRYNYYSQNTEIFYIFIRLVYLLVLFAGAYWGNFLGKKVYQETKKNLSLLENQEKLVKDLS